MKDGYSFQSIRTSVGRSLWFRSCDGRNCSRRATVRLGIDTLIVNILVTSMAPHTVILGFRYSSWQPETIYRRQSSSYELHAPLFCTQWFSR